MATFNKGDWVQITPTPDTRWNFWTTSHTALCGMFGDISDIELSEDEPKVTFVLVTIYDSNDAPAFQEWFMEQHVILTTKYDKFLKEERDKACDELQKWEKKKRQMVDDTLKKAFGLIPLEDPPKKKKKGDKKKSNTAQCAVSADGVEEVWEGDTEEYLVDEIENILEELDELDSCDYDNAWKYPDGAD